MFQNKTKLFILVQYKQWIPLVILITRICNKTIVLSTESNQQYWLQNIMWDYKNAMSCQNQGTVIKSQTIVIVWITLFNLIVQLSVLYIKNYNSV